MVETVAVQVRLPKALVKKIDVVSKRYYSGRSDFIRDATREKIYELERDKVTNEVREIRKQSEAEYLRKAGGDEDKAWQLLYEDLKKVGGDEEKRFAKIKKRDYKCL